MAKTHKETVNNCRCIDFLSNKNQSLELFLRLYLQVALSGLRVEIQKISQRAANFSNPCVEWILKEMRVIYYSDGSKSDSELYRKVEWYSYSRAL